MLGEPGCLRQQVKEVHGDRDQLLLVDPDRRLQAPKGEDRAGGMPCEPVWCRAGSRNGRVPWSAGSSGRQPAATRGSLIPPRPGPCAWTAGPQCLGFSGSRRVSKRRGSACWSGDAFRRLHRWRFGRHGLTLYSTQTRRDLRLIKGRQALHNPSTDASLGVPMRLGGLDNRVFREESGHMLPNAAALRVLHHPMRFIALLVLVGVAQLPAAQGAATPEPLTRWSTATADTFLEEVPGPGLNPLRSLGATNHFSWQAGYAMFTFEKLWRLTGEPKVLRLHQALRRPAGRRAGQRAQLLARGAGQFPPGVRDPVHVRADRAREVQGRGHKDPRRAPQLSEEFRRQLLARGMGQAPALGGRGFHG